MKKPVVILTGPTAVGKTNLSLQLAKAIGGEIVSADSMQVYRGMDVGSAKIKKSEMQGVTHHLIDILDPEEEFNVVTFQQLARQAMEEIWQRGHIPIVAGGTGFYIQALLYQINFTQTDSDEKLRSSYERLALEQGNEALHEILRARDPKSAEVIHANNRKRMIRALEYFDKTGCKISEHNQEERQRVSPYQFAYFVLTQDRKKLYEKINLRVDQMMHEGLVEEVQRLKDKGCHREMVSMQGIGYKEMFSYLDQTSSLEETTEAIKQDTRHFAKRQLTWFRRERDVIWIDKDQYGTDTDLIDYMIHILREKEIIHE